MYKPMKLRLLFNADYTFLTALPAWQLFQYKDDVKGLDDVVFARYKDMLVDPERYHAILNSWMMAHLDDFTRVYEALVAEYDPISNYDMIEKEGQISKEGEKISTAKQYGTNKAATTIPETRSDRYTTTYDSAATGRLDAYTTETITDAPTLDGHKAQITETTQEADAQNRQGTEMSESFSGGVEISAPESDLVGDKGSQRELTRKGNIGVTTAQQMIESEMKLRIEYNFVNYVCDIFAREMTLGVWDI